MSGRQWSRALGFICGLVVAMATVEASGTVSGLSYLTFNRPVALPGVTLGSGTYAFEIMNPTGGADVVIVRDRSRTKVYFSGLTRRVDRSDPARRDGAVMFGEAGANQPLPIVAWFPPDSAHGRMFLYRR